LSFLIKRDSVPRAVVTRVPEHHRLLLSEPALQELAVKCEKEKFRPYFTRAEGKQLVHLLGRLGKPVANGSLSTPARFVCSASLSLS
jgi:predicted nucleic acid-binding protein